MIIYLGLGVLVLLAVLWLLRVFVEADPARLVRAARMSFIALGVSLALVLLVVLVASGRLGLGLAEIGGLAPLALRGLVQWRRRRAATAPPPGQTSEIETDYLRMRLDHDTGIMSGTVRRGPFQGRHLSELGRDELVALWRECRAEDAQGASLLEAYLDRIMAGWREAGETEGAAARRPSDAMTREEAYAVLGLAAGASEAEIRAAYHRLMMKIHPDQGGSTYLAAQINRAREVLLRG
ncbi:MAG TPA: DnaJ domain-containing protein [Stellaceae bacterium]|nr:DnaJ domain-containing protein [Stellaceae bacterium]